MNIGSYIDALDVRTLLWLHQFLGRSKFLDDALHAGLDNSTVKFGPLIIAICFWWFSKNGEVALRREKLVGAVLSGLVAVVVGRFSAFAFPFRVRPIFRQDLDLAYPFVPIERTYSAFPSDHAVVAFALAASLWRVSPRFSIGALVYAALVVCFPRVYFGLHHPTDVFGGAIIGVLVAVAVALLPRRNLVQSALMELERSRPAVYYACGFLVLYQLMTMFNDMRAAANHVFAILHQIAA